MNDAWIIAGAIIAAAIIMSPHRVVEETPRITRMTDTIFIQASRSGTVKICDINERACKYAP